MATAVRLRDDFDAIRLRALARGSKDGPKARRLLSLATIYDGGSRADAANIGGVTLRLCAIGCSVSTRMARRVFLIARHRGRLRS